MTLKDLETQVLITAAATAAFFGRQPARVVRAGYRKKRDQKNRMARLSRKRNRG